MSEDSKLSNVRLKDEPNDLQYADGSGNSSAAAGTSGQGQQEGMRQNSLQRIQQRKQKVCFIIQAHRCDLF